MKRYTAAIGTLAFIGMVDTFVLAALRGENLPCTLTNGCEIVLKSDYSAVAGIPLPWIGLGFYFFAFSLAVFEGTGREGALRWLLIPSILGFAISLALIGIQAFVLHAWCQYCLLSAALTTTIFVLTLCSRRRMRDREEFRGN